MSFVFNLGSLDLSPYVRVGPQDGLDPYGEGWAAPQFSDAPFAEGRPLLNIDVANREMVWPLFLKGVGTSGTTYASTVGAIASLVSYWKLDEPSGTTASDSEGSNSLTYSGSFTLGAAGLLSGDSDAAVSFASGGKAQGASLPSNLNFPGAFTISAIVSNAAADGMICGSYNSSDGHGYNLWMNGGTLTFTIRGTTTVSVTAGGKTGANMHIVATFNGTTMTLYVNGASVGTNTTTAQTYSNPFQVAGNLQGTNNTNYVGVIDEVFACNTAIGSGTVTSLYTIYTNGPTGAVAAKDSLHSLVAQINQQIRSPSSSPLRVEWKDSGATNSTFYDVVHARWDPHFNYRLSEHSYADGAIRIWCQPPYGHTATERIIATAAGTAPGLTASLIGVASPLVGDVAPQLRVTLNTSGEPVGAAGRGVIVSAPDKAGYLPFISAASFVNVHPSAGVFGASGAPGSQAIYRQPFGDSGRLAQVGLGATMYTGRNRVFAAVMPAAHQVGMSVHATADSGDRIGPTAMAYRANGWQIVDLGTVNVPTSTPTTTLSLYADQPYRTPNDRQFMRPLPSGAGASSLGAIAGIYVLPEANTQALVDQNLRSLTRGFFGASGVATAALVNFVGELGETWTKLVTGGFDALTGASGAYVRMNDNGSNLFCANTKTVDNFRARAILHLGSGDQVPINVGVRRTDGLGHLNADVTALPTSLVRVLIDSNGNSIGTLMLASQAGMPAYTGGAQGLVIDVERRDRVVVINARLTGATGIGYIPSAGMGATVVPVACVAATSAVSNSQAGQPFFGWNGAGGIMPSSFISYLQFDGLTGAAQPSEAYRLTNVTGDTPLRSPISGSGPNVSLEGAKLGPLPELSASHTGIVAADWQLDGGPMNDPMGVDVRCRERFTYAR